MNSLDYVTSLLFRCHCFIHIVYVVVISELFWFCSQDISDNILYVDFLDMHVLAEPELLITPSLLVEELFTHSDEQRIGILVNNFRTNLGRVLDLSTGLTDPGRSSSHGFKEGLRFDDFVETAEGHSTCGTVPRLKASENGILTSVFCLIYLGAVVLRIKDRIVVRSIASGHTRSKESQGKG